MSLSLNKKVFDKFPILQTKRLVLRQMEANDAKAMFRFRSDPDAMKYMARPLHTKIEETEKLIQDSIQSFADQESIYWALVSKENDAVVGCAGYWRIMKDDLRAEIGYQLSPEHQGKGLMFEALRSIITFGFNEYKLHRIDADSDPRNVASIKILNKLGFVREGHIKENVYFNGEFLDSLIFGLLKKNKREHERKAIHSLDK